MAWSVLMFSRRGVGQWYTPEWNSAIGVCFRWLLFAAHLKVRGNIDIRLGIMLA